MSRPIKVLFLLEDLCFGGTQKQNLELALRLDRKRFAPAILTLTGPTDLDGEAADLEVMHLGGSARVPLLFFADLGPKLARLKPDILVPCTALPNIWGRLWGRLLGVPLIIGTCRGGGAPVRQHEKFLWRFADHIVCNSQASIDAMTNIGVPLNHLTYIANGLDTVRFTPASAKEAGSPPVIVCVARLAKDKNHTLLLEAFARVKSKFPDARLRLGGEGPEEAALKDIAAKLPGGCAEAIEFCGASADPLSWYQSGDIFALSSEREGQPNVILEAMACGLPICATAVGGIPALVSQGENGLLSPAGDVEKFAANLETLLANPATAKEMGQKGRFLACRNFSYKKMVDNHERLFEEQLEKRRGCRA